MKKQYLIAALALCCSTGAFAQSKLDLGGRATMRASRHAAMAISSPEVKAAIKSSSSADEPTYGAWVKLAPGHKASEIEIDGVEIKMSFGNTVMVSVTDSGLLALNDSPAVATIKLEQPVVAKMDNARALSNINAVHQGLNLPRAYTGKGVIAGIVDGGLDPNHLNFRHEDGSSRIQNFCYFRPLSQGGYNQENYGPDYMPQIDTETDDTFHGTHTLGIMAGGYRGTVNAGQLVPDPNDSKYLIPQVSEIPNPWYGVAYDSDISIACGANTDMLMAYGIADIVNFATYTAQQTGEVTPVVINLSLGTNVGPHDGSSTISQFMDMMIDEADENVPVSIVVAAGNEGDLPIAANKTFTEGDTDFYIGFKSLGLLDNYTDNDGNAMTNTMYGGVYVYSDSAEPFEEVQAVVFNRNRNGRIAARAQLPVDEAVSSEYGAARYMVSSEDYAQDATDRVDPTLGAYFIGYLGVGGMIDTAESGRFYSVVDMLLYDTDKNKDQYVVGLYIKGKPGQRVDVFTTGEYFVLDDLGLDNLATGSTDGTISDMATGKNVISVGSYNQRDYWTSVDGKIYMYEQFDNNLISSFSSYGTLIDGRQLPTVCAPGATVISSSNEYYIEKQKLNNAAIQGTYHDGDRRYSWHQCVGTSMACPVVSGSIALWYEANPNLTNAQIHDIIKKTARVDSDVKAGNPVQWGAGKFDAHAGLIEALNLTGIDAVSADSESRLIVRNVTPGIVEASLPGASAVTASLYDLSGRRVVESSASGDSISISTNALAHGIYLLRVNNEPAVKIAL